VTATSENRQPAPAVLGPPDWTDCECPVCGELPTITPPVENPLNDTYRTAQCACEQGRLHVRIRGTEHSLWDAWLRALESRQENRPRREEDPRTRLQQLTDAAKHVFKGQDVTPPDFAVDVRQEDHDGTLSTGSGPATAATDGEPHYHPLSEDPHHYCRCRDAAAPATAFHVLTDLADVAVALEALNRRALKPSALVDNVRDFAVREAQRLLTGEEEKT